MKESVLPLDGQTLGEDEFNEYGSEGTLCSKYFEESINKQEQPDENPDKRIFQRLATESRDNIQSNIERKPVKITAH